MPTVYTFIETLRQNKIYFTLNTYREKSIMVRADVPGERWEIEFFESGEIEIEIFKSNGEIFGKDKIKELIRKFAD